MENRTIKLVLFATVIKPGADTSFKVKVIGRDAWALLSLVAVGPRGCTPINRPAPRWSHYVWKLRRQGINVETIDEPHGGSFAGSHAKYVLRDHVDVGGGTLDAYLLSPEGRREFPFANFARAA